MSETTTLHHLAATLLSNQGIRVDEPDDNVLTIDESTSLTMTETDNGLRVRGLVDGKAVSDVDTEDFGKQAGAVFMWTEAVGRRR